MKCVSPISIKDARKKRASLRLTVPCGKCGSCLHNRRVEWSFRIKEEYDIAESAKFITLTYEDDHIVFTKGGYPTLCKRDLQTFLKRLRKKQSKITETKIRYYAVGEYGTRTLRPHYHIILFNVHSTLLSSIVDIWKLGQIHIGDVSDASIHYMTKYHVNANDRDELHEEQLREFATMSRKPGIGASYLERKAEWNKDHGRVYVMNNGYAQRMPRYYKEKIFSEAQRQVLADEAMSEAEKAYFKEFNRLMELGIQDPDKYMEESLYLEALKVAKKANKSDTF